MNNERTIFPVFITKIVLSKWIIILTITKRIYHIEYFLSTIVKLSTYFSETHKALKLCCEYNLARINLVATTYNMCSWLNLIYTSWVLPIEMRRASSSGEINYASPLKAFFPLVGLIDWKRPLKKKIQKEFFSYATRYVLKTDNHIQA